MADLPEGGTHDWVNQLTDRLTRLVDTLQNYSLRPALGIARYLIPKNGTLGDQAADSAVHDPGLRAIGADNEDRCERARREERAIVASEGRMDRDPGRGRALAAAAPGDDVRFRGGRCRRNRATAQLRE